MSLVASIHSHKSHCSHQESRSWGTGLHKLPWKTDVVWAQWWIKLVKGILVGQFSQIYQRYLAFCEESMKLSGMLQKVLGIISRDGTKLAFAQGSRYSRWRPRWPPKPFMVIFMRLYHIEWQTKGPFIGFLGQGIHWEHFWSGTMKFGNVLCYICKINWKVISKTYTVFPQFWASILTMNN